MALPLLPTSLVGSYAQPDWLIDREKLRGRFPPRVRATELWRVDPGFDATPLLTFQVELPESRYGAAHERTRFADTLIRELSSLPGVESTLAGQQPITQKFPQNLPV